MPRRRSRDRVLRDTRAIAKPVGERLRSIGFLLEVRIGNEVSTFNTAYFTSVVFFLRDAVCDHTTMCTGVGRAQWEGLWGFL